MTLLHELAKLPSEVTASFAHLEELIERHRSGVSRGEAFEVIEQSLHQAFLVAECRVLEALLSDYDIDVGEIELDGVRHRRVMRSEQSYVSVAGELRIERTLYRERGGRRCVCPLERRAGIVERRWTAKAAKLALQLVSQLTPYASAEVLREWGGMQPSRSSLDRLPKRLQGEWEAHREAFEAALRLPESVPRQAVAMAVCIDGVKVPMQGSQITPGDSRYEEASCASVSYYDAEGEELHTRRYGRMPEYKKKTLKAFVKAEVAWALGQRPELQLVQLADGAREYWRFFEHQLPAGEQVLDFYHAAQHLTAAFEAAHGEGSVEARRAYEHYRTVLLTKPQGIDTVIRRLTTLHKRRPRNQALEQELGYFKNNRQRCHYARLKAGGLPIGSGIVEATCKTLVTQRLKQSGMSWRELGGQAILTFRALLQSDLFDQGWQLLSRLYRQTVCVNGAALPTSDPPPAVAVST